MKETRRCFTCRKDKRQSAFPDNPWAKRCLKCSTPPPCIVCGAPCKRDRRTCGSEECLVETKRRAVGVAYRKWLKKNRRRTTRVCPSCDLRKPLTFEHWTAQKRNPDGSISKWNPYCRPCAATYARMLYELNPERRAKVNAKAARRYRAIVARRAADPEFDAEWRRYVRDSSRIYRQRRRERASAPQETERAPCGPFLPSGPFLDWIERQTARHEMSEEKFCEVFGICIRRVFDMRSGARVRLDTVDAASAREGSESLWDVYGETLYPEEEAVAA